MTSLRGLDGLNSKADSHRQNSGRNIRDESVIDNFIKQLSRGILDINDREVSKGNKSIFDFGLFDSQKKDPFKAVQAKMMSETIPEQDVEKSSTKVQDDIEQSEVTISQHVSHDELK